MDCVRSPSLSMSNTYIAIRDTNSYRILKMEPLKLDEIASGTSELN